MSGWTATVCRCYSGCGDTWIKKYSKYVESEWGEKGLEEYRNHLDDDFRVFIATLRSILKKIGQARNSNE
jgi:hypothetical protein